MVEEWKNLDAARGATKRVLGDGVSEKITELAESLSPAFLHDVLELLLKILQDEGVEFASMSEESALLLCMGQLRSEISKICHDYGGNANIKPKLVLVNSPSSNAVFLGGNHGKH
ncbi:MAG: hypothetical protein OXD01_05080 [Gammaproteobacteria bacterium]|nr:hypothetical protein [Gammaproteobacteria bacterium]